MSDKIVKISTYNVSSEKFMSWNKIWKLQRMWLDSYLEGDSQADFRAGPLSINEFG